MRELNLKVPEQEQIKINGEIFTIKMSDIEILNLANEIENRYKNIDTQDLKTITEALKEATNSIDKILGDGAVAKISGGKPIGFQVSVEWLKAICDVIGEKNNEYIKDKYE